MFLRVLVLASLAISVAVQVEIEVLSSSTVAFSFRLVFTAVLRIVLPSLLPGPIVCSPLFGELSVAVPICGQQRN